MPQPLSLDPSTFLLEGGWVGLLLIHGFTGSPTEMRLVGESLNQRGITVSAPCLPGHGTTLDDLNQRQWRDWSSHVAQEAANLQSRCETVFVGGLRGLFVAFPVNVLALDAQDPNRLVGFTYAYTGTTPLAADGGQTSTDGGATWTPWPAIPAGCTQLMVHPTQSGMLYLRCQAGLFRSLDLGQSWHMLSDQPGDLLAPDYGHPGQLLWARPDGLWVSRDDGLTWEKLTGPWLLYRHFLPALQNEP